MYDDTLAYFSISLISVVGCQVLIGGELGPAGALLQGPEVFSCFKDGSSGLWATHRVWKKIEGWGGGSSVPG